MFFPLTTDYNLLFLIFKYKTITGVAGFEPTREGVKVPCLTAWLYPNKKRRMMGIEPTNAGATIRCVNHFATIAITIIIIISHKKNRTFAKMSLIIPAAGVEPARPQRALDFESSASANSATPALNFIVLRR